VSTGNATRRSFGNPEVAPGFFLWGVGIAQWSIHFAKVCVMTSPLTLLNGPLRCELSPALGGCVAGLWFGAQQVLRSKAAANLRDVRVSGSYPLVPYSNRIGWRKLHWAGEDYSLPLNFAPEPHAIHGVGWERAWAVEQASETQVTLVYRHVADEAWPFAFDSRQTFTLGVNALEQQLSITNRAEVAAPVGLGWHPYFAKSAQTQLQFQAQGRWEMGDDKLPIRRLPHPGLDSDCHRMDVDHCFDGWNGALQLTEGDLRIRVTSDLHCLVVFTTPERDSIAIEPVSHINNALALAQLTGVTPESLGLRVLQPDEACAAHMRIQVEQAL
jgi:aldose 1-epimerase